MLHVRQLAAIAISVAGCASGPQPQPMTADYITEAILVPYCGRGGCHSTDTAARNLVFDTIDGSLAALTSTVDVHGKMTAMVVKNDPSRSRLYLVLRDSSRIMPPDIPLPDADVELIRAWIAAGADGLP